MSGWGQVSEDALGSELCGVSPSHNGCDFYLFLFSFYVIFKNHFEMCLKIKEDSRVSENCQVTLGNVRTELMKFRPAGATFGKDGREINVSLLLEGALEIMENSSSQTFGLRPLCTLKIEDPKEFLSVWIMYCCLLY